jgi:hydroxymethylbilane synthase
MSRRRGRTVRLATRGSELAIRQASAVRDRLEERRYDVELVEVETEGDRLREELIHRLGRTGAFVRALDERVLAGEVDAAVHSLKDMPTEFPEGLEVAAVPERAAAGDVLVTPDGTELADLPDGATVGTSSLRRRAQLLAERPDLTVEPLRGNVDTRVEKLLAPSLQRENQRRLEAAGELPAFDDAVDDEADEDEDADADEDDTPDYDRSPQEWLDDLSPVERAALERRVDVEYDAIVLAEAGLARSGLLEAVPHQRLPVTTAVPAPGQGALAVTAADEEIVDLLRDTLDHPVSRVTTTAERTILAELGGGCVAPIGVSATLKGDRVAVRVQVLGPDGEASVADTRELPVGTYAEAAATFARDLADRGAAALVDRARERADGDAGTDDEPADRADGDAAGGDE